MVFTPKGLRLHNPFNLEKSRDKWQGLIQDSLEPVFCEFESDLYGLRAGLINLKNQLKAGYNTIRKLVTKYAPPLKNGKLENNTEAYIKAVCKYTHLNDSDILTISNIKTLGEAIIIEEQGFLPYTDETLNKALTLAGVTINETVVVNGKPSLIDRLHNLLSSILPGKS